MGLGTELNRVCLWRGGDVQVVSQRSREESSKGYSPEIGLGSLETCLLSKYDFRAFPICRDIP